MPGASISKNIYGTASSYPYVLKVSFTETATSVANNTSVISISGSLYGQYVSWSSNYNSYLDLYWHDNRTNKNTLVATSAGFTGNAMGQTRSVSKSITVTHNADGKLSGYAAIQFRAGSTSGGWSPPSTWLQTASTVLTTIARASSISSLQGSALGSAVTVGISRASSSFTHKVEYSFAGSGWTSVSTSAATSASFTPPISLASRVPNATTGSLTVRVITMNGSAQVGSAVTKSINLSIPTSIVPTIGSATATRVDNGVPSAWGVYVVGFSQVKISFTASGASGSTIKSNSISGPGISANSNSATSSTFTVAGTKTYTCKTTDSRGRSATKSVSVTVVDYSNPSISVSAVRCNSDGTAYSDGTYLKVTCNYSIASVSGKNSVASRSVTCNGVSNTSFSSGATFVLAANCSIGSKYKLTATIKDALGKTATATIEIQTAERIMNVKANKKGIAFGGFAQRDGYTEIKNKLMVEQGLYMPRGANITNPETDKLQVNGRLFTTGALVSQGYLYARANDGEVKIGSENTSYVHFIGNRNFLFNKPLYVAGNIYGGTSYDRRLAYTDEVLLLSSGGWLSGPLISKSYAVLGYNRFTYDSEWIGFYASTANAQGGVNRKGYIGHDKKVNFSFCNEAGGAMVSNKTWTISSDKRLKKDIENMSDIYIDIWKELDPKVFRWNELNPNDGKKEFGLIAQDVMAAFEKHGLDYNDYTLVTRFQLGTSEQRKKAKDENKDEEYFSLSYDHYFMMTAQVVKKQQEEIDTLKQEVSELKDLVKQLLGKEVS